MNSSKFMYLLAATMMVSGCVPVVAAGVGTAVGVSAVQEGGLSQAAEDAVIQTKINDLWFRYDTSMFMKLDMTVNQGRVLITGVVQNPQHRVEAVRLAWQVTGVKQVINEIKVAESDGVVGYAKDAWITTRLRGAITVDGDIESLNYSIDTVQGTVYLMGFAQDQKELDHVIEIARTIPNVKQVVSYVKLVGEPYDPQPQNGAVQNYYEGGDNVGGLAPNDMNGTPPAPVADGEPIDWNNQQGSLYD
jgi:osmotically-inducible protein OsmY